MYVRRELIGLSLGVSNRWTGFSTGTWDWNVGLDYLTGTWDWTTGLEHCPQKYTYHACQRPLSRSSSGRAPKLTVTNVIDVPLPHFRLEL